ncbi:MAG: penicillin acylase family protein [Anaerolineae bacterium]
MTIIAALLLVIGLLLLVVAGLVWFVRRPLPQTKGVCTLNGLREPVEVIRDPWGVPHIYARSEPDLFFAQGFIHAQDRLWQMELQRRAGSGRLSELVGEATLELDRFFRVVGLNRAAQAEFDALDAEVRRILEWYTAGVNAYLDAHAGRLPVEFTLLRHQPEPWQPVDALYLSKLMAWTLSGNWASELLRARLATKLGAARAADLEPPYPEENPPIVHGPHSTADAAPPPNGWGSQALRDALHLVETWFQADVPSDPASASPPAPGLVAGGSNQWVVAGSRSATGHPLLANDTHLALSMPAGWYEIHLHGAGYNVTGVSFPGAPGVVVGHNEHCAWGLTTAWQDAQDLYIEKLNPEAPHQYLYQDQWHIAQQVREEIKVKGRSQPIVQQVLITRHGPIISEVVGETVPLALCWTAHKPENLLRSVINYNRARNWEQFRSALAHWGAPSHNFVYADVEGNIGYVQAGRVPIRARGYGQVPVPGWTGEYEWLGYLSVDQLPQVYNPESGWLATANHLVVDETYPHFLSSDLENPCRARRVVDLITAADRLTASDCLRFQLDTYSTQARRFVQHLLSIEPENERERAAQSYLQAWDYHLEPDSVAASIYQVARLRALHLVFGPHLEELLDAYLGLDNLSPVPGTSLYFGRSIVRLLDLLDGKGNDDWLLRPAGPASQERTRAEILRLALQEALDLLQGTYGPHMEDWSWGTLNQVHFAHQVGEVKPLHLLFNRGPYPIGGDQDTLLRASGEPKFPFPPIAAGDAVRFVADLSDWEQSRIVIPGGQSGHPASRHYADLIPLWRTGRCPPMPFTRSSVERHARARLGLIPKS